MKLPHLVGFCCCAFLAASLAAKDVATYPSSAAKAHIGEYATIVGSVSGVHVTSKGDTFVNLGAPYPDNDFTAVIFAADADKFGDLESLEGKTVSVTGTIKAFKGKPEIVVQAPELLKPKSN